MTNFIVVAISQLYMYQIIALYILNSHDVTCTSRKLEKRLWYIKSPSGKQNKY